MTPRLLFVFDQHDPWEKSIQGLTTLVASRHSSLILLDTSSPSHTSLALLASRLSMMGLSTLGAWQPQFDRSQLAAYAKSQEATCVVLLEQEFPRNLSQIQQRLALEKTGLEVIILSPKNPPLPPENSLSPRENQLSPRENPLSPRENPLSPRENPLLPPKNLVAKLSQLAREPLLRQKVLV